MSKRFSLQQLAEKTGSRVLGDPEAIVTGVNSLEDANGEDISFLANSRYTEALKRSKALAFCVDTAQDDGRNYLLSDNPSLAFQKIGELFLSSSTKSGFCGIHPTAVIHESAHLEEGVTIGPYAVIDRDVFIGKGSSIGPHVSLGVGVQIGQECVIHPSCTIREFCSLGNRVILQPGAVIGSCGFGYLPDEKGHFHKLEQLGNVILEDDVEIGANTTIDRSRFKTTFVKKGSKIDNLVQIAHNVQIGEHTVIAAQTGIAGSAKLGRHNMLGGQVGVLGHVTLDDGVRLATRSGASKNLKKGDYRGSPAIPIGEFHRQEVYIRKLKELFERLKKLEERLPKES